MSGAFDDVEIIYAPDPKDPTNQLVLVANKNPNNTIAVNVRITAPKSVQLLSLNRTSIGLFPHEFKVTVQAGASQYIGRRRFDRVVAVIPTVVDQIEQTFVATGAVFERDEPQPPPFKDISYFLAFYEIDVPAPDPNKPMDATTLIFMMNLNRQFRVHATLASTNVPNDWMAVNLSVFECQLNLQLNLYVNTVAIRRSWRVSAGKMIPDYTLFDG